LRVDIHRPELVMVGRRDLVIGTPDEKTPTVYDGMFHVALVHVVALEDLPVSPPKPANGAQG
jgi:hypothetical protein